MVTHCSLGTMGTILHTMHLLIREKSYSGTKLVPKCPFLILLQLLSHRIRFDTEFQSVFRNQYSAKKLCSAPTHMDSKSFYGSFTLFLNMVNKIRK